MPDPSSTPAEPAPSGPAPAHQRARVAGLPRWGWVVVGCTGLVVLLLVFWTLSSFWSGRGGIASPYGPVELAASLNPRDIPVGPERGRMAPDFILQRPDGSTLQLSDLRGQPVVLNFWATWCAPCRAEMPDLQAAADRYAEQGVVVIGINVQEEAGIIQDFANRFRLRFPLVQDLSGKVTSEAYRVGTLPSTWFVGADGQIKEVQFGAMNAETIERRLEAALER